MHNSTHPFDRKGQVVYHDNEITIHAGNVFEAKTDRGRKVLLIAMLQSNDHIFYIFGHRKMKSPTHIFVRLVKDGTLKPVPVDELDTDQLTNVQIVLDSVGNRRSVEEQLLYMEREAMERGITLME